MPDKAYCWHTNEPASDTDPPVYWEVTGSPPNLTVKPSINIGPEIWHGWITDGEMKP